MSRIQILMYHQVGCFEPMKAHRATYCDHRRFASQMRYLKRFGYSVLSMDQALACLRDEQPTPPKAVVLTFDDGYENFHEYAWPILQSHGFPALVYLIAGRLGQDASWLCDDDLPSAPLMSADRVRELRRQGVSFGAHSVNHVRLAQQQDTRVIRDEVFRSKAMLEEVLGEPVAHFCYPYGSHDRRVVDAVADAGYLSATTCVRSPATMDDDPLTLPRKAISFGDNLIGYFWRLHVKNTAKHPFIRRDGMSFAAARG